MNIPFVDMAAKISAERGELHAALDRVLDGRVLILGSEVTALEKELGVACGVAAERVVSCNSGTDALVLSLKAMGVGSGDEVIVPSHTAVPTVTAIRLVGAIPKFADIDPDTWVVNASDALSLVGKNTKAVIAVHLYGNGVNLSALSGVRALLIEDVAQAQGGRFGDTAFGAWGRFGAYSFYPTKNLGALGDGGALVCREEADSIRARSLRFYGQSSRYKAELDHGMNSRLDELQAAFLRVRLPAMQRELAAKEGVRRWYEAALAGLPLRLQAVTPGCSPAWHLFVVAFESEAVREKVRSALEAAGIGSLIHYPVPNHLQPAFREFRGRPLPVTESLCGRILSLPFHAWLSEAEVQRVADVIRKTLA